MERARLMGVTRSEHSGSGYAVGERLVLTSAHVVHQLGERVKVFQPGGDHTFEGLVVWCGTPGGRDDAALVLVDDDPQWRAPREPVRWGRLVTDRPGTGCETWGLPDIAQRPVKDARALADDTAPPEYSPETEQIRGEVNPGTGMVGNRYVMHLPKDTPQWAQPGSPWSGLSGAAVACDRLLIGVVIAGRAHSAHGQLNVVPAYVLHHNPAFRIALAEHGGGARGLEAVEFQHLADITAATPPDGLASPAALLQAGRQVVPFRGREELLEDLETWCARAGFGARLLHGPGGQGKTRLAHQLAARLAAQKWAVLWPRPSASPEVLREIRHASKPLLIVLDYAESRTEQLAALIEAAAEHPGTAPLKLLLLARTEGEWWSHAKAVSRLAEDYLGSAAAILLPPLEDQLSDRDQAYRAAVSALAGALPQVSGYTGHDWPAEANALPVPRLAEEGYGNALTLHMTALADLLDAAAPTEPAVQWQGAENVEDRLLGHESRYWERAALIHSLKPGLSRDSLETALAAAHLVGATNPEQADQVWRRIPALADQVRDRRNALNAWIASLYPPTVPGEPWGSLQPDRLAERHIGRVLDKDPGLAEHLLTGADEHQRAQLLTVYSRTAAHSVFRGRLNIHLTHLCIQHRSQLAGQIISAATQVEHSEPFINALDAMVADLATPLDDLTALSSLWPNFSARLAPTAVRLAQTLTERFRPLAEEDPGEYLPFLVQALHNLSLRLGEVGRHEEGLAAVQEAVNVRYFLSQVDPDTHLPRLAMSLNNLFARLASVGRYEEALTAIREAVRIRHTLAKSDPGTHLSDLAMSLDNLAGALGKMGQSEEGLVAAQQAVHFYRTLTRGNTATHLPGLARSLHTLSVLLRELDRDQESLTAIQEAVRIRQEIAEKDPDAHLPDLSASLEILFILLREAGRQEESLAVIHEALRIDRFLAEALPGAFLPGLAASLYNLSVQLKDMGRQEESLTMIRESVSTLRTLTRDHSDAHLPKLAHALQQLSHMLSYVGLREEALVSSREAVHHRRTLAQAQPNTQNFYDLADALHDHSLLNREAGPREEGHEAIREAVHIRQLLANAHPELFNDQLQDSLKVAAWFDSSQ
jgi:tetratricopeptide (TPR) repeat protein